MDMELIIMDLIVNSGSARSFAMEAISLAKEGKFDDAYKSLDEADESLAGAHRIQTDLIQNEAAGNHAPVTLLLVHAQDHLMTSIVVKDLAREFVELYEANSKN